MKLGIITDIHYGPIRKFHGELMGDGRDALVKVELLLKEMKNQGVEMFVNLGDNISEESALYDKLKLYEVKAMFDNSNLPNCFVLGNHEVTTLTKEVAMESLNMSKSYYAIYTDLERLIFLDAQDRTCSGLIDNDQLGWLERQLANTEKAYVFVHQSLAESDLKGNRWFGRDPAGGYIKNRKEVRKILQKNNNVKLVVNGHLHQNRFQLINSIEYYTVGSWSEFKALPVRCESYTSGSWSKFNLPEARCESYAMLDTKTGTFSFLNNCEISFDKTLAD